MRGRRHIVASMVALLGLAACANAEDATKSDSDKWQYAKGLFRKQMDSPKENLNIGLHYWVELTPKGSKEHERVSNKHAFRSGDQIQFHIRPNIDGYAYVVMRSGSRGESSVLFPDPAHGDNNRVEHGIDYALPSGNESFEFDKNAGTEKVTLLLSRNPINAQAYLAKPTDSPTVIASASIGSKDLVPSQVFVAYAAPHSDGPPPAVHVTEKKKTVANKTSPSTPVTPDEAGESKAAKKHKTSKTSTTTTTASTGKQQSTTQTVSSNSNEDAGITSVIKKSGDGVLFVNVDLDHRS
ncbi:MAG: DUF4384 domain-containing protein [Cyanobacteria bacterium SZAS-4]|nr:DUF4384 domain-containing protein [Cyanobacteria bacterium SZAS-4]